MRPGGPQRHHEGMSTDPRPPSSVTQTVPPRILAWLTDEISAWASSGLISPEQARGITERYRASRRLSLATLVLTLGAAFVGIGVIWLVAANLDELPPLLRFGLVAAFWLATMAGAEWLASRQAESSRIPAPLVVALRMLATLAFGAVVFQAAQSLQVSAYAPKLLGLWAIGAVVYAYAVRSLGPLVLGLGLGAAWFAWQVPWEHPSVLGVMLAFGAISVTGLSLGALHEKWWPDFAEPWREFGALAGLVTLFIAAVPSATREDFAWTITLTIGLAVAGLTAAAALAVGGRWLRFEPVVAIAVVGVSVGLILWEAGADPEHVGLAGWGHAAAAVSAYLVTAAGVAALGVLRDSWRLTAIATAALVVFTTFQAFAVFAKIITGAWLFVVLGLIFLATGFLADRGRRQLAASLEGEEES